MNEEHKAIAEEIFSMFDQGHLAPVEALNATAALLQELIDAPDNTPPGAKWRLGDMVQKVRGSKWRGKVVGFYSTEATPIGYSVESAFEPGSVQVWPEAALIEWKESK